MAVMVGIANVLLAVPLIVQHRANRDYNGPGWWASGQSLVAIAVVFGNLRGNSGLGRLVIPLWQAMLLIGFMLVYVGLGAFLGHRVRVAPLALGASALVAWSTLFTFGVNSLTVRSVGLYTSLGVVLGLMAVLVWRHRAPDVPRSTSYLTVVFAATALLYFGLALGAALIREAPEAILQPSPAKTAAYVGALGCTVLWVFGLEFLLNERLQAKVATDAENMQRVFATSPDCAIISRLHDGVMVDVNDGFTRVTGFARAEAVGRSSIAIDLWHETGDRQTMVDLLRSAGECENLPTVLRRRDGTLIDCLVSARTIHLGAEPHLISITRDVTEQRRLEAQLQREATTDALTGVANRRQFLAIAEQRLQAAKTQAQPLALAVVDVDHFKGINDTLGHTAGDAALCHFTEVAERVIGPSGVIGRLGGDEFGVLLPLMSSSTALELVQAVARSLDARYRDERIPLTISAGVAELISSQDSVEGLIVQADIALYEAKESGRNRVVAATPTGQAPTGQAPAG